MKVSPGPSILEMLEKHLADHTKAGASADYLRGVAVGIAGIRNPYGLLGHKVARPFAESVDEALEVARETASK